MHIFIIIRMNIYIEPKVERELRKEKSMSGLVNTLLREWYGIPGEAVKETADSRRVAKTVKKAKER